MGEKNRLYPHLMPREIPIWESWLQDFPDRFDRYDYDVRVGESIIPPPDVDANMAEMAVSLAKKRIDVVGWKGENPSIIEIKEYSGLTAIGQLIAYPILFVREFPTIPPPDVILITGRILPDVGNILDILGIPYFVLAPL